MLAIVRVALHRPYTFVVLAIVIALFGILAAFRTPTDIFPDIGIPVVSVVWTYNGLPPEDMSGRVVYYYERTITTMVSDIEHIESQSLPGYGVVKIFFQPSVNINAALAQITAASQTVLKYLPPGITPPYVLQFNASSVPILQIALSSQTASEQQLFDQAQNFIRPQLSTVRGAAIPSPYGGKVRQIEVNLNPEAMQARGLSAQDVVEAVQAQNLATPVGTEKVGPFEYTVALNDSPETVSELNNLPIRRVNGTIVYVHDVAQVLDSYPPQTNVVRVDGKRAVLMTIQKAGSASTLDVIAGVRAILPRIEASLPKGVTITLLGDQSTAVRDAVDGVLREGAIAAALTGAMILVFLGSWRSTAIIMVSIPLAILSSLTILSALGETINVMTLGGLALAVGILVDDATVTIENINWHLEHGKPVETAIMDGARQIVVPAFVSLACICIVFVPMFQLGGVAGYLFRPLAEAVVFAMISSFVLSRTLVPTMANYLLKPHSSHQTHKPGPFSRFHRGFERRFEAFRSRYVRLLEGALNARFRFCVIFLAIVTLSFGLAPFLGRDFFPEAPGSQIKLHVRAQTGTRIEETASLCDRIEAAVKTVIPPHDIRSIVDNLGLPISGINMAYSNSGQIGPEDADVMISLTSRDLPVAAYVDRLRATLPSAFPGTSFSFLPADISTQILNFGSPAPIDVQIAGKNEGELRGYAETVMKRMAHVPGIADLRLQQPVNEPTLRVDVDRSLASEVGVTERDVATSLQSTLSGSGQVAPMFWLNPRNGVSYPIVVQTPQYKVDTLGDLSDVPITATASADGAHQLLGALANVTHTETDGVISHYNVQPVLDIYAAIHGRDLGAVSGDIETILADTAKDVPPGSLVALRGQASTMLSAYSQLFAGLGFAILLIYLLIVVNFQSWVDPFVIITALPAALAGIVWMLFITWTRLSVPALTGAIMCMGVATANSVLVVSFARERMASGADALTAAIEAGSMRLRPVLMTALAMVIGMAPMALSADQNAPLGRAVIGGLICATIATLFFVPTVFSIAHRERATGRASPGTAVSSHA